MYNGFLMTQKATVICLIALVSGCSTLGTQQTYSQQQNEIAIPENWEASAEYVNTNFTNQLLSLVDEESVATLVQQSLTANYDLRATAVRLKQTRILQRQTDIDKQPTLDAKFQGGRSKNGTISNSQTLSMDLSWELDVWGRLADASAASEATTHATELDYQYAKNSLAARLIQAWLDISYRSKIIALEELWVTSLINTEDIIKEQVIDGMKEKADLDAAKAATERVRATLASRRYSQINAIRNLNVLRGYSSNNIDDISIQNPAVNAPPEVLPGDVIGSRPDLIAAYQRIIAADKTTDVSYKELLPKISLTASVNHTGSNINQMLEGSSAWNLLGSITAPLFNREKIKNNAKISELKAELSFLDYQKVLLNALTEVENALNEEASFKQQETHLRKAYEYSYTSMLNYQNLYQDGGSDILSLLVAKQSAFQSKIQLLQTEQARFSNRITLGLALGMGV